MLGPGALADPLSHAVACRYDQIMPERLERFDRRRKKRKIIPVRRSRGRPTLKKRSVDRFFEELPGNLASVQEKREYLGLRVDLRNSFEAFLPPSHSVQPVMRKGDTKLARLCAQVSKTLR